MTVTEEIQTIFATRGGSAYFGEDVSLTEHARQAARLAQLAAAPTALVVAALLHDIGHLLANAPDDLGEWLEDARHEESGSRWLAARFPPAVAEPVRLHVPAKRFLCATDPGYFSKLSPASVVTLELQGGPMTAAEVESFRTEPYHREAVQLRRWDDEAKVAGLMTPDVAEYRTHIEALRAELRIP
jgi:gamma-butyrobetaine dioxygenase